VNRLSFVRVVLDYGCHRRAVDLPTDGAPVVVAGPNGAGKTTLVEALVRVPFGYLRRQERDGRDLAERRPWSAGPYAGRVELVDARGGRHAVERDFASDRVRIERDGEPAWDGDGNPGATNVEAMACRERLSALFGIASAESWARLAWVRQGELVDTRLDEHLLRLASGGTHDVERARAGIEEACRALTREPVGEGSRAGRSPRRLEELEARARALRDEADAARAARDRRAPLVAAVERIAARASAVAAEVAMLEAAQAAISRRDALARDRERIEARLASADRIHRRLEREADLCERLERAWSAIERRLPADFPERAARIEQLDERLARAALREERARGELASSTVPSAAWLALPLALGAGAVAAAALGRPAAGILAALGSMAWLVWLVRDRTAAARADAARRQAAALCARECSDLARALDAEWRALPLDLGGLTAARADWLHQDRLGRDRERAAAAVVRTSADAVELLEGELFGDAALDARSGSLDRATGAREMAVRLGHHLTELRNRLAHATLALAEAEIHPDLGGGHDDAASVSERLRALGAERETLAAELRRAERRLAEDGRPSRSPLALEEELLALGADTRELAERIDAHRAAHALVIDAHRSFREHDERRLAAAISRRVLSLTGGALGPVELGGLGPRSPGVRHGDRVLPLRCPPLSYGQYHAVLLGVRLGASDVLAASGPPLPLILDEPFAHLDESHARAVWDQLVAVARERQVVVATQETALLARLAVTPAVRLEPLPAAAVRDAS
jgi:hypothetical protein